MGKIRVGTWVLTDTTAKYLLIYCRNYFKDEQIDTSYINNYILKNNFFICNDGEPAYSFADEPRTFKFPSFGLAYLDLYGNRVMWCYLVPDNEGRVATTNVCTITNEVE